MILIRTVVMSKNNTCGKGKDHLDANDDSLTNKNLFVYTFKALKTSSTDMVVVENMPINVHYYVQLLDTIFWSITCNKNF